MLSKWQRKGEKGKEKKPSKESIRQTSESDMVGILELSDQEIKTDVINMVRPVMGKVGNMQEQVWRWLLDYNTQSTVHVRDNW